MVRKQFQIGFALLLSCIATSEALAQSSGHEALAKARYYADLYNWEAAEPLFKTAEGALQATDPKNALYAHIGVLREVRNRPITESTQQLSKLLALNKYLQHDDELRVFALTVKGDLDGTLDASAAREDWNQVITLSKKLHNEKWIYRAEGQLGFCDYYQGDLASTQRRVISALTAATQAGDVGAQVFFLSTMGLGLSSLNMLNASALDYVEKAIALANSHPEVGEPFIANEARVILLAKAGKVKEAQERITELLAQANRMSANRLNYTYAAGFVALAAKDVSSATEYFERAFAMTKVFGITRGGADVQAMLSKLYLQQGKLRQAENAARNAVNSLKKGGVLTALPGSLDVYAQVLIAEKRYQAAKLVYEEAEAFQNSLVGRGDSLMNKTAAITGADQLYAHHFALLADNFGDVDDAHKVIEQGRARGVVDLLLAQRVSVPDAQSLDRKIAQLRIEMANLHSEDAIKKQEEAIFIAEATRAADPDLSAVGRHPFAPVPVKNVQSRLGPSEMLLEFVLSNPRSYVVVLTATSKHIVTLDSRELIESSAKDYLDTVHQQSSAKEQAQKLYGMLLKPIPRIQDFSHYTIIADGLLNQVPVDALMDEGNTYVVQNHVVAYCPSSTTLFLLRANRAANHNNGLLAVGGIPYSGTSVKAAAKERGYSNDGIFADLPNSEQEAQLALKSLPSPTNRDLSGAAATETNVKKALSLGFDYVHLAVHAFASDNPNQAAIVVLSDPQNQEDGFIEAAEIARQHIRTNLVVLSACETAVGPIQGQEGASTLTTAFLLAGSHAVISTLWRIEDRPALRLMETFYKHLGRGESASDSLASAKREMLSTFGQKSLPIYWAGFVIQGSPAKDISATASNIYRD